MKVKTNTNGSENCKYILLHLDEIRIVSHVPESIMDVLAKSFCLKDDPTKNKAHAKNTGYLGTHVGVKKLPGVPSSWYMSEDSFIK